MKIVYYLELLQNRLTKFVFLALLFLAISFIVEDCSLFAMYCREDLSGLERTIKGIVENKSSSFDPKKHYSSKELQEKICAVHVTTFFPRGMKMVSGSLKRDGSLTGKERGLLHFALGNMVMSHGEEGQNSWENRTIGIIVPLKFLNSQMINLNFYDTYILGDFKIPSGATIVMSDNEAKKNRVPEGYNVVIYNSEVTTLRKSIEKTLDEIGCWKVQMENKSEYDSPAMIKDKNINTSTFFESYLKEFPSVSFGSHAESEKGNAFRFQMIEPIYESYRTNFGHLLADFNLTKLKKEISLRHVPEDALIGFTRWNLEQMRTIDTSFENLFSRDVSSLKIKEEAVKLSLLPFDEFREFIVSLKQKFPKEADIINLLETVTYLQKGLYSIRSDEDKEKCLSLFLEKLRQSKGGGNSSFLEEVILKCVEDDLDPKSSKVSKILKFLKSEELQHLFKENHQEIPKFDSLMDFIKSYKGVNDIFVNYKERIEILKKVAPGQVSMFEMDENLSFMNASTIHSYLVSFLKFDTPLNKIDQRDRGFILSRPTLEIINLLGLQDEYQRMFSSEEEFFRSPLTFSDIYKKLKRSKKN